MSPLFSVIIPTCNRASLLKIAIQSVIDQSVNNWELIIIDDGSTDHTKEVVLSFQNENIYYFFQKNKDRCAARNEGIEKAKGQYICFMDDDDYFLKDHLHHFYQYLTQNNYPKTILRNGFLQEFYNGKRVKTANYDFKIHKNPLRFSAFNMCGIWSLCIPSEFLISEKFPSNFPHWQDTHLILRLLANYPFYQLDSYTYIYRIHQQMGSIDLFTKEDFLKRMKLNLDAIRDLFEKETLSNNKYLPLDTKDFLLAEKQLQYAVKGVRVLGPKKSFEIFRDTFNIKVSIKFWRYYLAFIKQNILKLL